MIAIPETVALMVGRRLGRNNFSYFISPKKTIEGLIGQFLGVIPALGVVYFFAWTFNLDFVGFTLFKLTATGLAIIFIEVLGDLIESVMKRGKHVKDSSESQIIGGGLGGVLDKFDSFSVGFIFTSIVINVLRPDSFPNLSN